MDRRFHESSHLHEQPVLDPKTLRKTGLNAMFADRLQTLTCVRELSALIETWSSIPEQAGTVILRQAASIQIGVRELRFPIAGSICKIAAGVLILRLVQP